MRDRTPAGLCPFPLPIPGPHTASDTAHNVPICRAMMSIRTLAPSSRQRKNLPVLPVFRPSDPVLTPGHPPLGSTSPADVTQMSLIEALEERDKAVAASPQAQTKDPAAGSGAGPAEDSASAAQVEVERQLVAAAEHAVGHSSHKRDKVLPSPRDTATVLLLISLCPSNVVVCACQHTSVAPSSFRTLSLDRWARLISIYFESLAKAATEKCVAILLPLFRRICLDCLDVLTVWVHSCRFSW